MSETGRRFTRLIRGQFEGYLEAFANVYLEAARAIKAEVSGEQIPEDIDVPNVADGIQGMSFLAAAVESAKKGGVWTRLT